MTAVFHILQVKTRVVSIAYHANNRSERAIQSLSGPLLSYSKSFWPTIEYQYSKWPSLIPYAEKTYNSLPHAELRVSPNRLLFSCEDKNMPDFKVEALSITAPSFDSYVVSLNGVFGQNAVKLHNTIKVKQAAQHAKRRPVIHHFKPVVCSLYTFL